MEPTPATMIYNRRFHDAGHENVPEKMLTLCQKFCSMKDKHTMQKAEAVHHENTDKLRELSFYQYEINVMEERMREITDKYTSDSVREKIASFREQLIVKQRELDALSNDFTNEEFILAYKLEKMGDKADTDLKRAWELYDRMVVFQNEILELREQVNDFLITVM